MDATEGHHERFPYLNLGVAPGDQEAPCQR